MKAILWPALLLTFLIAAARAQQLPIQAEDFYSRGIRLMDAGDLDGAIASFNRAVAHQPDNADAFFERGVAWCLKIEVEAALADFDKAISMAPNRVDFYRRRAQCLMRYVTDNEEKRAVIADIDRGLAIDPRNAELYFFRGVVQITIEDYAAALVDFDKAVACDPADARYYLSRGHLKLVFLRDYRGAVNDLDKAIALGTGESKSEAYATRGRAQLFLGRRAEAESDFRKCRQLDPRCAQALERLDGQIKRSRRKRRTN